MFNETYAHSDGTIIRNPDRSAPFAATPEDWVLSGPHFFLANPFNKTPRAICSANSDYDAFDLEICPTTICRAPTIARWGSSRIRPPHTKSGLERNGDRNVALG